MSATDREIALAGEGLAIPGVISATGLELPEDLPYDRWLSIGETLMRMEKSIQWWIGDWMKFGERKYGEMYSQALEVTDYSYSSLANMKWVADRVESSRRRELLSWAHHGVVAALPPDSQDEMLDEAIDNGWSEKQLRKEVQWGKYVAGRMLPPGDLPLDVPDTFDLIYADPPWRYEGTVTESRSVENQYPTMALEDICALPVLSKAREDCMLFLWATPPLIQDAFEVMRAWGFNYAAQMIWDKQYIGMGHYVRYAHEILLIGKRGEVPTPRDDARPSSVFSTPRSIHSRKPIEFYELLENMYPDLQKLELFCRTPRVGWTAWGLEVERGAA